MESKTFNTETIEQILSKGVPGFGDAFVGQVMHRLDKIRRLHPSRKHPALDPKTLASLKYSMLVQFIKKKPETKLAISMEFTVVNSKQIGDELLNEKLAEMVGNEIRATELGRRFVEEFESNQAKDK